MRAGHASRRRHRPPAEAASSETRLPDGPDESARRAAEGEGRAPPDDVLPPFDAVVLAGGRARRMGGVDKPLMRLGGRTLLERTAESVEDARALIVVGPRRVVPPRARVVMESPPGAGPVPALGAGLALASARWVAVLAADLPFLSTEAVGILRTSARQGDGALLVDDEGKEQWLVGVWRTSLLRRALGAYTGASMRGLLGPLRPARVTMAIPEGTPPPWLDCDTMDDITTAREWM